MSTTTYHLVVVKSVRDGADADPVHTAKKVELAAGKLGEFAGKDEGAMIAAFQRFVNGEAAAEEPAEEPAAAGGPEEGAAGAADGEEGESAPEAGAEEPGFE